MEREVITLSHKELYEILFNDSSKDFISVEDKISHVDEDLSEIVDIYYSAVIQRVSDGKFFQCNYLTSDIINCVDMSISLEEVFPVIRSSIVYK